MGDAVIAMADGYPADEVAPFVRSLRATGYDGEIVLLVTRAGPGHHELAAQHEVDVVELRRLVPTVPMIRRVARSAVFRLARRGWAALPPLFAVLRSVERAFRREPRLTRIAIANLYPPALARYAYCHAYVERMRPARVLLSDVRDVLFQSDPFATFGDGQDLQVFVEDRRATLGSDPYNLEWLSSGYGRAVAHELAGASIVCSGVTFGALAPMTEYLDAMLGELARIRVAQGGTDQACHNVLVHRRALRASAKGNEAGPVLTMGHVPPGDLRWDGDLIVDDSGAPYAVLHQYDRHEGIALDVLDSRCVRRGRAPA